MFIFLTFNILIDFKSLNSPKKKNPFPYTTILTIILINKKKPRRIGTNCVLLIKEAETFQYIYRIGFGISTNAHYSKRTRENNVFIHGNKFSNVNLK